MARRSGGALLVRAVLVAVAVGLGTAATSVWSPVSTGAIPAAIGGQVTGIPSAHPAAVAQPDPGHAASIVAGAAASAADPIPEAHRGSAVDSRRDTITQPVERRHKVPTAATFPPPPPSVASPARSTITAVAARSTSAAKSSIGSSRHAAAATAYRGHNHVWIPSLGISRSLRSFPCSRSRPPDAGVYRWGCAGRNNVYLMSHAWSAFEPLHDAYVAHRLRKGMKVWYADGVGRVRQFSVIWWRVTPPTTTWAWAAQSRPSMTLQTCVGARDQFRLIVRLVRVG